MLLSVLLLPFERLVKVFREIRFRTLAFFLVVLILGILIGAYLQGAGRLDILGIILSKPP